MYEGYPSRGAILRCDVLFQFSTNTNIFVLVFVVSFTDRTRSELQHTYSSFLFFIPLLHSSSSFLYIYMQPAMYANLQVLNQNSLNWSQYIPDPLYLP